MAALRPIVIRFGRVGDMVMLSPLLNLLHRRFGMPCWLIGSGEWSEQLYQGHDDVAGVWSVAGRHTPLLLGPSWWRVIWTLRHSGDSPIYIAEANTSPQLNRIKGALRLAGVAPERCVFLPEEDMRNGGEHRVDNLVQFGTHTPAALKAADYPWPQVQPAPRLKALNEERLSCNAWIKDRGWSGRPIVLVWPGNRRNMRQRWRPDGLDHKAWSVANWSALLRRIHDSLPQAQMVLCGSRDELPLLREIQASTALEQVVAVQMPLGRLLPLCEVVHSAISVDTGPAHIAAAMGSPLVVLFGNSSPRHWLPRSFCHAPVIALGGVPQVTHVNQIPVQAVFDAWRSLPAAAGV